MRPASGRSSRPPARSAPSRPRPATPRERRPGAAPTASPAPPSRRGRRAGPAPPARGERLLEGVLEGVRGVDDGAVRAVAARERREVGGLQVVATTRPGNSRSWCIRIVPYMPLFTIRTTIGSAPARPSRARGRSSGSRRRPRRRPPSAPGAPPSPRPPRARRSPSRRCTARAGVRKRAELVVAVDEAREVAGPLGHDRVVAEAIAEEGDDRPISTRSPAGGDACRSSTKSARAAAVHSAQRAPSIGSSAAASSGEPETMPRSASKTRPSSAGSACTWTIVCAGRGSSSSV